MDTVYKEDNPTVTKKLTGTYKIFANYGGSDNGEG